MKARETYEKVAEHGEQAVRTWRGEAAEEIEELAIAVEPNAEPVEVKVATDEKMPAPAAAPTPAPVEAKAAPAPARKPAAKKAPARKPAAKKTTPPTK
ncbi:hypothetical protein STRTUCAR8_06044 [Streptomyces turgidiscabies Car8]|uniref:Uncharacterized protein n=1 Tax=Streptomyces turgidiscabies (strain Car8) TaxID=698760 RepID=L7FBV0_STRT8|nr:hypothetical protein STRTUCAR8_06044 [Streptomyces turgidiscabies Car8]